MNSKPCVYYIASILLIYHINIVKITTCYGPEGPKALPRVTVLSSHTLDLSQWRANLDVDVVKFPAGNLSFFDALKVAEIISGATQGLNGTKAIIGSGNKLLDRLIANTLGLLVVPFISYLKQNDYQGQLYLNLSPSIITDHIAIAFNIADELSCQHVTMFTSRSHRSEILQQIQTRAKRSYVSASVAQLQLNDTPIGIMRMMQEIFQIAKNYNSVLVIMDCSEQDASLLIEASHSVDTIVQFHVQWLFLRGDEQSTDKVEYLPINMLSPRSKFDRRYWVQDALLLLNGSLYTQDYENKFGNAGSICSNVTNQFMLYK
ncbi:uncharacterized protein LOC111322184 [Stylophora pistillata]|uniref:uncharacterized protein LOC111322184 n=1 Tax=Stylophora pistillata TaxID=50429 RepID=UPI000C042908|nr:uncharacterized protein LOC111322184 [Stylophora pistillata]